MRRVILVMGGVAAVVALVWLGVRSNPGGAPTPASPAPAGPIGAPASQMPRGNAGADRSSSVSLCGRIARNGAAGSRQSHLATRAERRVSPRPAAGRRRSVARGAVSGHFQSEQQVGDHRDLGPERLGGRGALADLRDHQRICGTNAQRLGSRTLSAAAGSSGSAGSKTSFGLRILGSGLRAVVLGGTSAAAGSRLGHLERYLGAVRPSRPGHIGAAGRVGLLRRDPGASPTGMAGEPKFRRRCSILVSLCPEAWVGKNCARVYGVFHNAVFFRLAANARGSSVGGVGAFGRRSAPLGTGMRIPAPTPRVEWARSEDDLRPFRRRKRSSFDVCQRTHSPAVPPALPEPRKPGSPPNAPQSSRPERLQQRLQRPVEPARTRDERNAPRASTPPGRGVAW
jgi:hypothetical protein